jgi:hypothetical protein
MHIKNKSNKKRCIYGKKINFDLDECNRCTNGKRRSNYIQLVSFKKEKKNLSINLYHSIECIQIAADGLVYRLSAKKKEIKIMYYKVLVVRVFG